MSNCLLDSRHYSQANTEFLSMYFPQTFSLVCPYRAADVPLPFNGFTSPVDDEKNNLSESSKLNMQNNECECEKGQNSLPQPILTLFYSHSMHLRTKNKLTIHFQSNSFELAKKTSLNTINYKKKEQIDKESKKKLNLYVTFECVCSVWKNGGDAFFGMSEVCVLFSVGKLIYDE